MLDVDPAADADARVVEVRIRLDEPEALASLTNLQVDVLIELDAGQGQASGDQPQHDGAEQDRITQNRSSHSATD